MVSNGQSKPESFFSITLTSKQKSVKLEASTNTSDRPTTVSSEAMDSRLRTDADCTIMLEALYIADPSIRNTGYKWKYIVEPRRYNVKDE